MTAALASTWPVAAAAKGERLAFVTSEADGDVVVVDLGTEGARTTLPVGKVPHAMAIGRGGEIFVSNRGSKELTVIDAGTARVSATIPLPATSFQLAASPDGTKIAVAYKDALDLSIVDVSTHAIMTAEWLT
jgi:YVTN family beta-propeller protein